VIKKIFSFLVPAIFALLLISCNDSPTDLGKDFLLQDGVGIYSFDSSIDSMNQTSRQIKKVYSLGSSARLLIGKAENVKAHSLLKFVFSYADTITTQIKNNELKILDSWVELVKDYRFGDSASTFDYAAYKITSNWTSFGFTTDSLPFLTRESNDISSLRSTENDTLYTFHIDTTVTSFWLHTYADTGFNGYNYGLLISPTDNAQQVLGFKAFTVSDLDVTLLKIVVQKPGSYIDTLFAYISSDVSVVEGEVAVVGDENIAIQASLTSQAGLFFDLSVLPENITINSATLTVTVDSVLTKTGSSYSNLLLAYLVADSTKDSVDANYFADLTSSGNTFTGNISNIVRAWNNNVSNQGMILKAFSEVYGIELFVIKGSNAAIESQRPKLKIVYSRK
jgi:hypothetical protein